MRQTRTAALVAAAFVIPFVCSAVRAANHALIVSGFKPREFKYENEDNVGSAVWNDPLLFYEVLRWGQGDSTNIRVNGLSHDEIHLLYAGGEDWDALQRGRRYNPAERFGPGYQITDDSGAISEIWRYIRAFAYGGQVGREHIDSLSSTDTLFVYFTGHGGWDHVEHGWLSVGPVTESTWVAGMPGHYVYHGDSLMDTTFAQMLESIPSHPRCCVLMQQCMSGSFIKDLKDQNVTIACAADTDQYAWMADDKSRSHGDVTENEQLDSTGKQYHGEFSYHFLNALRGRGVASGIGIETFPYWDPNYDTNTTWKEAFRYATAVDSRDWEHPMYWPDYNCWEACDFVPEGPREKTVKGGGALAALTDPTDSTWIYAFKGNNTCEFYRYSTSQDSWTTAESITPVGSSGKRKRVKQGSVLAGVGNMVYGAKGNNSREWWRYDPSAAAGAKWTQLADVPAGTKALKGGSGEVGVDVGESSFVYLLKGSGTTEFYRYYIDAGAWQSMASAPAGVSGTGFKNGSCLAYDGDSLIYALKGTHGEFFSYNSRTNSWVTLPTLPRTGSGGCKKVKQGAGLACDNGFVYAQKGGNSNEFWLYHVGQASWNETDTVPLSPSRKKVSYGGALVAARGFVWSLKGNNTREFKRFLVNPVDTVPASEPPSPGPTEELVSEGDDILSPRWSHAADKVCFVRDDESGYQNLFVAGVGDSTVQLTYLQGEVRDPTWCFNDSLIGFTFEHKDSLYSQIAYIPADPSVGGNATILTSSQTWHELPDWHPDTLALICQVEDSAGYQQVCLVSVADGSEELLTSGEHDHEQPKWASSNVLVFLREGDDATVQVYKKTSGDPQETKLTSISAEHDRLAAAPTSGDVVFEVLDQSSGYSQIGKTPVANPDEQILTSGNFDFVSPSVSPGGEVIHCLRCTESGDAVCQVDASGNGYSDLTEADAERNDPSSVITAMAVVTAAYVRDEGVYHTIEAQRDNEQGAGRFDPTIQPGLAQPVPSLFNRTTLIRYATNIQGPVRLQVVDVTGRKVRTLVNQTQRPGRYNLVWDARGDRRNRLPEGVYFLDYRTPNYRQTRKVVLAR